MKKVILILFLFPSFLFAQNFILNEIFIGELKEGVQNEPVYLGDSLVTYVRAGERFVCRYREPSFYITFADGRNGLVKANITRSSNQKLFKITYPYDLFPFTKKHTIYGLSMYSECGYAQVIYWLKYFKDSADYSALILKAYNKDTTALFSLVNMPMLDSDGVSEWGFNVWKVVNSYSDKELAQMMINRNRAGRREMLYSLSGQRSYAVWTPFGEENDLYWLYYKTWYPLTWKLYEFEMANENKAGNEYNRRFKDIKKQIAKVY